MRPITLFIAVALTGCGAEESRQAELASTLARADEALIRTRPALVAGKYARMRADLYAFFRGSLSVYRHDWRLCNDGLCASKGGSGGPLPLGIGDPHPENFGTLRAADGSLGLEPNDLDAADRVPFLWDVRRLLVGLALAVRLSNDGAPEARELASKSTATVLREAAASYAAAIASLAKGGPRTRIASADAETVLDDLFGRSERDHADRRELTDLTELSGGVRRLRRGVLDPAEPTQTFADLPGGAREALPVALETYRVTLIAPPDAGFFTVLDAVREFGSGVASWPRVRAVLLVRGPSDDPSDDVLLELKELSDSTMPGWYPPGVYADSVTDCVLETARAAWARPDAEPLWGVTSWMGFPCQVRAETEGQKTLRVSRLVEERGTPDALTALGRRLGGLLARVHATPFGGEAEPAEAIAAAIGPDAAAFAGQQALVAEKYADRVASDWPSFAKALDDLGPTLGVPEDPSDAPSPDLAALYGTPPQP